MHHITCWHALAGTYRPVTYDKNKKETLQTLPDLAVFLYDFCKIFMNTNFTKHFQLTGCSNCFRFFFFFGTFLCFFFCCFIISIGTYLTCVCLLFKPFLASYKQHLCTMDWGLSLLTLNCIIITSLVLVTKVKRTVS